MLRILSSMFTIELTNDVVVNTLRISSHSAIAATNYFIEKGGWLTIDQSKISDCRPYQVAGDPAMRGIAEGHRTETGSEPKH